MDKEQMLFTINSQRDVINNMKMESAMYNRKKQHSPFTIPVVIGPDGA